MPESEVIPMVDTSKKTIERIFFEQIKKMTLEASFDLQCSDAWIRRWIKMNFVKAELDFYDEEAIAIMVDDEDILSLEEQAFMHGYLAA